MKKVLVLLVIALSLFILVGCNPAETVQHNIANSADKFNVYRKVTIINLRSDKVLLEVEGYISMQNTTNEKGLAIVIKVAPETYKMHYVYTGPEIVTLVEQLENTTTNPYHWKITIYAILPEITGAE